MSPEAPTVLLVEDNHDVREGLARVLRRSGYHVATAENGLDALAKLEGGRFGAVISDIMMPVMDGIRLYQVIEVRHPQMAKRVMFVSAWFDDPEVQSFLVRTGRPILRKPFEITDFLRAYQESSPLTMAELWVFPLMLRAALVEDLGRRAVEVTRRQHDRGACSRRRTGRRISPASSVGRAQPL